MTLTKIRSMVQREDELTLVYIVLYVIRAGRCTASITRVLIRESHDRTGPKTSVVEL